jgi:hypothetical protein
VKGLCNNDDGFVGDEDANARSKNDKRENLYCPTPGFEWLCLVANESSML